MNHQLPTIPSELLIWWDEIISESQRHHGRHHPRAMQMAAAWGVALAEWEIESTGE